MNGIQAFALASITISVITLAVLVRILIKDLKPERPKDLPAEPEGLPVEPEPHPPTFRPQEPPKEKQPNIEERDEREGTGILSDAKGVP
jgi:hypothetical protein